MKLYIFNVFFKGGITCKHEVLHIFADSEDIADVKACQEMRRNKKLKDAEGRYFVSSHDVIM